MKPCLRRSFGALACAIGVAGAQAQPEQLWFEVLDAGTYYSLTPDGAGGVFFAGGTTGNLDGQNAGKTDAFVVRYDAAGLQRWVKQFGTAEEDYSTALAPDGTGGVFVLGNTDGDLGGPSLGNGDMFLARHDADGGLIWIVHFGTSGSDAARGLGPDGAGGVFVAGSTGGSLGGPNAGGADVFLALYDSDGDQTWAVQFGNSEFNNTLSVAPDGAGGVFIAGETDGDLGGPSAGGLDAFLARHDGAGNQAWIMQFGTDLSDRALALTPDDGGGVFVAGFTGGSLGGPSAGGVDGFLARLDGGGGQTWVTQFGTNKHDFALALAPDGAGGTYVAGYSNGDLGGPHLGMNDAYIIGHDGAGARGWSTQIGTTKHDNAQALAPDTAGGVFVAGQWGGPAFIARYGDACDADCDGSGVLDLFDFLCYVNLFNAGDNSADCTGDQVLDLFDFLCYVNLFNTGC